tara:strand:- start:2447 stop:3250 length:804 start_codon:yes stop_codon:yes gene_type:complete
MYVVDCINPHCGKPYRKNSAKEKQGFCPDCQMKRRTDGNNTRIGIQKTKENYVKRLEDIENKLDDMITGNDMYLEALQGELGAIVNAKIHEANEGLGFEYASQFKELSYQLKTSIATVNSRIIRTDDEIKKIKKKLRIIRTDAYQLKTSIATVNSRRKMSKSTGRRLNISGNVGNRKIAQEKRNVVLQVVLTILQDAPTPLSTKQIFWLVQKSASIDVNKLPSINTFRKILNEGVTSNALIMKGRKGRPRYVIDRNYQMHYPPVSDD